MVTDIVFPDFNALGRAGARRGAPIDVGRVTPRDTCGNCLLVILAGGTTPEGEDTDPERTCPLRFFMFVGFALSNLYSALALFGSNLPSCLLTESPATSRILSNLLATRIEKDETKAGRRRAIEPMSVNSIGAILKISTIALNSALKIF